MALFKKKSTDPAELDRIRAEIVAMAVRLDQSDAEKHELRAGLQGIVTRLDTPVTPAPTAQPATPPPPPTPPAITSADLDMLRARLQRLSDRIDLVDARITSISTELANQITELSGDVESIGNQPTPVVETSGDDTVEIEIVNEIRDAQVRLANEQARYQIAFRQDLADLVEKLRRA